MANSTYDNMWQTAMGELSEQLHVEGVDDGDDGDGGGGGGNVVSLPSALNTAGLSNLCALLSGAP